MYNVFILFIQRETSRNEKKSTTVGARAGTRLKWGGGPANPRIREPTITRDQPGNSTQSRPLVSVHTARSLRSWRQSAASSIFATDPTFSDAWRFCRRCCAPAFAALGLRRRSPAPPFRNPRERLIRVARPLGVPGPSGTTRPARTSVRASVRSRRFHRNHRTPFAPACGGYHGAAGTRAPRTGHPRRAVRRRSRRHRRHHRRKLRERSGTVRRAPGYVAPEGANDQGYGGKPGPPPPPPPPAILLGGGGRAVEQGRLSPRHLGRVVHLRGVRRVLGVDVRRVDRGAVRGVEPVVSESRLETRASSSSARSCASRVVPSGRRMSFGGRTKCVAAMVVASPLPLPLPLLGPPLPPLLPEWVGAPADAASAAGSRGWGTDSPRTISGPT